MKRSHTGESNLLPHFSFISAGEGGGNSWLNGYSGPRPFNNWTRGIDSNGFPDSCPDDLFGPLSDYPDVSIPASSMGPNPTLPYLLQDNQDCNRTQSDVPVIVLEDEHIRAAITPQWGGKIWSMFDKKHKRQMVFNNPAHQPYTIGYLHAWTSGGAEWNWSPGYVGHSVFSESDTWAAKLETERGPVVRVWEYDRLNSSVWQVDMLFEDDVMYAHAKITNPATMAPWARDVVARRRAVEAAAEAEADEEAEVGECDDGVAGASRLATLAATIRAQRHELRELGVRVAALEKGAR